MRKKDPGFKRDVKVEIMGGVIGGVILIVLQFIFPWVGIVWTWLVGFVGYKFNTPLWLLMIIFVAGAATMFGLFYYARLVANKETQRTNLKRQQPGWHMYTQDTFDTQVNFKWKWGNPNGLMEVFAISKYCIKDNCILIGDSCPICTYHYSDGNLREHAILIRIQHKIDNDLWQEVVAKYPNKSATPY